MQASETRARRDVSPCANVKELAEQRAGKQSLVLFFTHCACLEVIAGCESYDSIVTAVMESEAFFLLPHYSRRMRQITQPSNTPMSMIEVK